MSIYTPPTEGAGESARSSGRRKGNGADLALESETVSGLDALVEATLRVVDKEGEPVAIAAVRALESIIPDPDTLDRLAARGLASYAQEALASMRRLPGGDTQDARDARERFAARFAGIRSFHSPKRMADVMERVALSGADGRVKSLIDFTMADVRAFRLLADSQSTAWTRRIKAMSEYEAMLTKHKAETGRALPDAALTKLRRLAQEAWA